ncbi:MAG: hypothetical protein QOE37_490, partial [Microbacteriaceae bacterium]|nr:hypothetical protein [Microbacteriaceae bacterium]
MSDGIAISGGGSIAVDTPAMVRASAALEAARTDLAALAAELGGCLGDGGWPALDDGPRVHARAALEDALLACRGAVGAVESAAAGLRTGALRYGAAEARLADAVRGTVSAVAGMGGIGL